jgi:hypothetical protein
VHDDVRARADESMALADIRLGAHSGLRSDIARGPKSANSGSEGALFDWPIEPCEQRWWQVSAPMLVMDLSLMQINQCGLISRGRAGTFAG